MGTHTKHRRKHESCIEEHREEEQHPAYRRDSVERGEYVSRLSNTSRALYVPPILTNQI